jgi:hypothetical protein
MSTVPADSGGQMAMIVLLETTVKAVTAVLPKDTAELPVKPLPDIVTITPPPTLAEEGATPVTDGAEPPENV